MKKFALIAVAILAELYLASKFIDFENELPKRHGVIDYHLYLGENENQPLIVGFGGAEGGNSWTRHHWKKQRDQFLDSGYAFLAIEYFGGHKTQAELDRISLNAIHDTIINVVRRHSIDTSQIILIGGSKGGELILNLASRYDDYTGVIALVPGKASFPAHTVMASTSSWMYNGQEVQFAPAPWSSVIPLIKGDLRRAFELILEDEEAVQEAAISIENINGPILFISGTKDEQWPSMEMSEDMIRLLKQQNFNYHYEHIAIPGGHGAPLDHFELVHEFLYEFF